MPLTETFKCKLEKRRKRKKEKISNPATMSRFYLSMSGENRECVKTKKKYKHHRAGNMMSIYY